MNSRRKFYDKILIIKFKIYRKIGKHTVSHFELTDLLIFCSLILDVNKIDITSQV